MPGPFAIPNPVSTLGFRMSNSNKMVFFPANAITEAILILTKDFPSPLKEEVTRMTDLSTLLRTYCRFDRTIRNCSATILRVVLLTISDLLAKECPTSPNIGAVVIFSISNRVLTLSLSTSPPKTKRAGTAIPIKIAISCIERRLGFTGVFET